MIPNLSRLVGHGAHLFRVDPLLRHVLRGARAPSPPSSVHDICYGYSSCVVGVMCVVGAEAAEHVLEWGAQE